MGDPVIKRWLQSIFNYTNTTDLVQLTPLQVFIRRAFTLTASERDQEWRTEIHYSEGRLDLTHNVEYYFHLPTLRQLGGILISGGTRPDSLNSIRWGGVEG